MSESRRASRRYEKKLDVSVHGPGLHIVGYTVDISRYGLLVQSTEPRRVGELTQLWLSVKDDTWIQVLAIVARVLPNLPGFGVRLHMMGGEEKALWDELLESLGDNNLPEGTEDKEIAEQTSNLPRFLVRPRNAKHLENMIDKEIRLGGMFVRTPLPRPEGSEVEMLLIHPMTERAFRMIGQVVVEHRRGPLQERGNAILFAGTQLTGGTTLVGRFKDFCAREREFAQAN